MSMKIICKGEKLFKELDNGVEIEIFGAEKAHYLTEMGRIDQGAKVGEKITRDYHRVGCQCAECWKNWSMDQLID